MKKKSFTVAILSSILLASSLCCFELNKTTPLFTRADLTTTGWISRDGGVTAISGSTTGVQFDLAGYGSRVSTSGKLNLEGLTFDVTAELRSKQDVSNGDYCIYFSNDTNAYPSTDGSSYGHFPIITVHNNVNGQTRIAFSKEYVWFPQLDKTIAYSSATGDTKFSNAQTTDGTAILNQDTTQSLRFQFKTASDNDNRYEVSVHELVGQKIWGDNPNFGKSDLTDHYCFRAYIDKSSFEDLADGCEYLFVASKSGANIKVENVQFLVPIKGVIDGVVTPDTYTTMVRSGLVPPDYLAFGYSFDGWYTDSSVSTPLTKVEASTQVIYGKLTSLKTKKIRFDIAQSSFAGQGAYLYAFESNGTKNAEWPGVPLQMDGNLSEWVNVPYDATVIINNGNGAQSNNIQLSGLDSDICYIVNESDSNTGYWASNGHYYLLGNEQFNQIISHTGTWGDGGNYQIPDITGGSDMAYLEATISLDNTELRAVKGNNAGYDWLNSGDYNGILISKNENNIVLKSGDYKFFINSEDTLYVSVTASTFANNWLYMLRSNCNSSGEGSNLEGIQYIWANIKNDFNTLATTEEKELFTKATPSDVSSIYRDSAELYDLIYSKYSQRLDLEDFMGRFSDNTLARFYQLNPLDDLIDFNANNVTYIVIIAAASISTLIILLIVKKRKRI